MIKKVVSWLNKLDHMAFTYEQFKIEAKVFISSEAKHFKQRWICGLKCVDEVCRSKVYEVTKASSIQYLWYTGGIHKIFLYKNDKRIHCVKIGKPCMPPYSMMEDGDGDGERMSLSEYYAIDKQRTTDFYNEV